MAFEVSQITPALAASAMAAAGLRAPVDCDTVDQIAAHGECFQLVTDSGACVFVLRQKGAVLWIDGAGATEKSTGITEAGLQLAEQIAKQTGCTQIAFETSRPGLLRKSKNMGFAVAGYIIKKSIA